MKYEMIIRQLGDMDTSDFVEAWNKFCIQAGRGNKHMIFQNCEDVVNELYGTDKAWSIACDFGSTCWHPEQRWISFYAGRPYSFNVHELHKFANITEFIDWISNNNLWSTYGLANFEDADDLGELTYYVKQALEKSGMPYLRYRIYCERGDGTLVTKIVKEN